MRISDRAHIPRLITALHIPEIIICDNGSVMPGGEAILLLLFWFSFPRTLAIAQDFYGLEYSQLSRIVRTTIPTLAMNWQHLMDNNLDFYSPRFEMYNAAIVNKYIQLYGLIDMKYATTSLFSDGTQCQHNRDRRTNFNGHKKFYCLGYLVIVAPDGMIVDLSGPFAGRKNDHMKQNESQLSQRLIHSQANNLVRFDTATDKGK